MKVKELLELVKGGSLLIEIDNTDVGFDAMLKVFFIVGVVFVINVVVLPMVQKRVSQMKKRTKHNKSYKIIVHDADYDETVILSLFIIVINLIMTILMCVD